MHTMGASCFSWDDSETNLGRRSARGKKGITVSMHSVLSPQQKQTPTEGMAQACLWSSWQFPAAYLWCHIHTTQAGRDGESAQAFGGATVRPRPHKRRTARRRRAACIYSRQQGVVVYKDGRESKSDKVMLLFIFHHTLIVRSTCHSCDG